MCCHIAYFLFLYVKKAGGLEGRKSYIPIKLWGGGGGRCLGS